MGKYDKIGINPNNSIEVLLSIISNELAESNRLKRLEIKQYTNVESQKIKLDWISKGGTWEGTKGIESFFKELDDQA